MNTIKKNGTKPVLKNGPELTDREIDRWCKSNVSGYWKSIDRTKIPKQMKELRPGDSTIVNLDPNYANGGTHWVAIRRGSEGPYIIYYDSFGIPPPTELMDYTKANNIGLLYCDFQFQKIDETNCGWRAATFLKKLSDAGLQKKEIETFRSICA